MLFALYVLLILLMTATSSFCESTPISYASLIIPLCFFRKREYLLCLILFSASIFYRVPPGIPVLPLLIIFYIASVIFEKRFIQNDWKINYKGFIYLVIAIAFLTYSCYTSITGSYDNLPLNILYFSLLFYTYYDTNCNISLFQKSLLIASVVWIIFVFAFLVINPYLFDGTRRTLSVFHNPNVVVRGVAMMITIVFLSRYFSWGNISNKLKNIAIVLGLLAIVLTGGRTGIIASIFTIAAIVYSSMKNKSRFIKYAFVLLLLCLMSLPFLSLMDVNWGRLEGGFSIESMQNDTRTFSSGILWKNAISNHPVTGVGLGNENSKIILGYVPDADNMYVDVLTQLGLVGLISLITIMVASLKRINKYIKNKKVPFGVLAMPMSFIILQIGFSMTETVFDELFIWYALALTNIYINSINNGLVSINSRS